MSAAANRRARGRAIVSLALEIERRLNLRPKPKGRKTQTAVSGLIAWEGWLALCEAAEAWARKNAEKDGTK